MRDIEYTTVQQGQSFRVRLGTNVLTSVNAVPETCALEDNVPNPFNPRTAISYQLSADSDVELSVFDMNGRKVASLVNGFRTAGYHEVNWDASRFSSGIYFYRLVAGDFVDTKKMVFVK